MANRVEGQGAQGGFAITPSDTVDLIRPVNALWIGSTGDVTIIAPSGETVLYSGVPDGCILPVAATRVKATGTTASSITGMTY